MPAWLLNKYVLGGIVGLILIVMVTLAIKSYGNGRYREGVADTDARWQEASRRLQEQAAQSAGRADDAAALRLQENANQLREEQERIDEATRNGNSTFDVLFGS